MKRVSEPRSSESRLSRTRPTRIPIAAGVVLAIAMQAPVAHAQSPCGEWTQVAPPAGATLAVSEVTAVSADDAWAFAIPLGLIRWDGTAWSQFPIEDPFGNYPTVWIDRFGLVSTSHLFLAGRGDTGPFSNDQVLKIWDGTSWSDWHSLTLQPNIMGAPRNGAAAVVVGAAPDDVWILGVASGTGDGVNGNLLLTVHWDGSDLTEVVSPGVGNSRNELNDAVLFASDDIWAVGLFRNVGGSNSGFHAATYHWDGSNWGYVPNPVESTQQSTEFHTVAGVAPDDVWAAGSDGNEPLFAHWDGSSWSIVPAPETTGTIHEMVAIASDDVWAVDSPAQVPLIGKFYHWDGVAWSIVMPQDIPGATNVSRHAGLAAAGPCDVWAVGSINFGQGVEPFIERLDAASSQEPGTPLCLGGTGCPCGNEDPTAGCRNSTGSGGLLAGTGTTSLGADDLVLHASQLPPDNSGLFYMGDALAAAPFFDGKQCALGSTFRFLTDIQDTGPDGTMTLGPGIAAASGSMITTGGTWYFHAWHRDASPGPGPCGTGANLTNVYAVTFQP